MPQFGPVIFTSTSSVAAVPTLNVGANDTIFKREFMTRFLPPR